MTYTIKSYRYEIDAHGRMEFVIQSVEVEDAGDAIKMMDTLLKAGSITVRR